MKCLDIITLIFILKFRIVDNDDVVDDEADDDDVADDDTGDGENDRCATIPTCLHRISLAHRHH